MLLFGKGFGLHIKGTLVTPKLDATWRFSISMYFTYYDVRVVRHKLYIISI